MKIITSTCVFPYDHDPFLSMIRLKNAGFRYLDLAMDDCSRNEYYSGEGWKAWAHRLREEADRQGVCYLQAHSFGDALTRNALICRGFEICRILGIRYTVVHPIFKKADGSFLESDDEFLSVNVPAYRALSEIAAQSGVTILSENLLWGASIRPSALSALVSEVNMPNFGWCYDTGHANVHGLKCTELIGLQNAPLSLHIQDNNGTWRDEHLIPGDGNIDWKLFLDTLYTIGYQGELVLEAHHQCQEAPDDQRDTILKELYARAEKMRCYYSEKAQKLTP